MQIIKVEQGSQEWFEARLGVPTASNFDKIVTSKGEASKQRLKYLYKLAGEKVSGRTEESYKSDAMIRGTEIEDEARNLYYIITNKEVKQVGFCLSDGFGCSPDGLVEEDGLLEIKCPLISTHVGYLLSNVLPTDYVQQVQGQLLVTGRKYVDFLSYYPGLKPLLVRVERDNKFLEKLKSELTTFCAELQKVISDIE